MRTLIVIILLLLAGLFAGWQAENHASLRQRLMLRSLAAQLEPMGTLSHQQASAHFWGSGEITGLRFEPSETLRARHALPAGFALQIPLLRYREWQDGERWPARFRLDFDQASLPLEAPWPRQFSGSLDWQYSVETGSLRLAGQLEALGAASLQGELALKLAQPASLRLATLIKASLHYRDQGLAQGERAALAARLGADPQNANAALAEALANWLAAQGAPANANVRTALAAFAGEPTALTLKLDPPGALRPETLPQFAPADRLTALGLSLENR
ncbi:MAG: hypothetical protein V4650_07600 [Pseudomonadota bacterium]